MTKAFDFNEKVVNGMDFLQRVKVLENNKNNLKELGLEKEYNFISSLYDELDYKKFSFDGNFTLVKENNTYIQDFLFIKFKEIWKEKFNNDFLLEYIDFGKLCNEYYLHEDSLNKNITISAYNEDTEEYIYYYVFSNDINWHEYFHFDYFFG